MGMGPVRPGGAISEINVTPLVDVMLVLLIIFMITAPMIDKQKVSKQKVGVDLPRTDAESIDLQEERKIILAIQEDRKILVDDVVIADCGPERDREHLLAAGGCMDEVEQKLVGNVKLQQDREIYLLADRRVPYGLVVSTMARLKKAGVDKLGMVTDPPGGPAPAGGGSPPEGGPAPAP
ncbi:MAG: biopolymer transporter ExbD [Myxococcota bacterium]|nr:biopolymer transporter ExbD [Myxococcota bacterium]